MKPLCDLCGTRHESYQAHVFATNRNATNRVATNSATNKKAVPLDERASDAPSGALDLGSAVAKAEPAKTPNRRSREAYNAYQREYMRKRRTK